ncbi:creatininase family protein [Ectothiorhodospira variabilis]|uniref:creatininase family protein n=1 Tax=Ectothiorhodospira variabilis TaxID=505694 RepID=UPI001EFB132D|nr:creatininase family protein [Ectothiorhodospira variabilis]MCG5496137.1 creatininase family protein [Ectothiorhodospira variabilis]
MHVGQDRWQDLTAPELASRMGPETVAVMVLGAVEQHGPHLPLSTDLDIGLGLLTEARRHLPADFPLLVMPPLALGSSEEHGGFPGTLLGFYGERLAQLLQEAASLPWDARPAPGPRD